MTGTRPFTTPRRRGALPLASLILLASCAPALAQTGVDPGAGPEGARPPEGPASTRAHPAPPQQQAAEKGTIQVTGQAQISVPADQVRISFAVETEGVTAGEATAGNAARMDAVMGALRGTGVQNLDIETFGYNLRPEYEVSRETPGTRRISGYRVENNIRVTFKDLEAIGRVMDQAVEAGANRVASLTFSASDTREAKLEALRQAVASARDQAETIASAMGVRLGMAQEVQGGASAPNPRSPGAMMLRASAEVATPIEAGDLMVSASVSITYEILEEGR